MKSIGYSQFNNGSFKLELNKNTYEDYETLIIIVEAYTRMYEIDFTEFTRFSLSKVMSTLLSVSFVGRFIDKKKTSLEVLEPLLLRFLIDSISWYLLGGPAGVEHEKSNNE